MLNVGVTTVSRADWLVHEKQPSLEMFIAKEMIQRKVMIAIDTLAAFNSDLPVTPRSDDGMVSICEMIWMMVEALANEIMDAQAEDACVVGNLCNGYCGRTLVTSVGAINLRTSGLRRDSHFPGDLLVRYSWVDRAVIAAVLEIVTSGVSTGVFVSINPGCASL